MKEPKLHLVRLDENIRWKSSDLDNKSSILIRNLKGMIFEGYLVNFSATSLYFEPKDREGLIIVPHSWVKWCVPIVLDWSDTE